jgi:hypothetical protein
VKAKNKKDAFCNRINVYFCNGLSVYFEVQNESINFRKLSLVANKLKTTKQLALFVSKLKEHRVMQQIHVLMSKVSEVQS